MLNSSPLYFTIMTHRCDPDSSQKKTYNLFIRQNICENKSLKIFEDLLCARAKMHHFVFVTDPTITLSLSWVGCIILMIMYRVCDEDGVSCRLSLHSWRWSCCLRISIVTRHTSLRSGSGSAGQLWQTSASRGPLSGAGISVTMWTHLRAASNPKLYKAGSVRETVSKWYQPHHLTSSWWYVVTRPQTCTRVNWHKNFKYINPSQDTTDNISSTELTKAIKYLNAPN